MTDTHKSGLSSAEAAERLKTYGPNDVEELHLGWARKILGPLVSPISLMLLGAAGLSYWNSQIFDGWFILALYATNYLVGRWQEFKADRALAVLRGKLSFDVQVRRDEAWTCIDARALVPDDYIRLGLGSLIPADATVCVAAHLSVNEAALSGESLPKDKAIGDTIYSGSFITTGEVEARVTATGRRTSFGKTIFSIERPAGRSILERDILSITRFLTAISLFSVAVLTATFFWRGYDVRSLLTLDASLVIAGVPVALPAVMTIILSIGAAGLARRMVVVRRLSALQDLSNVDVLLTDKTGTLTKNQISVARVIPYGAESAQTVLELAARVAANPPDAIDLAILAGAGALPPAEIVRFVPYDSERKRSTALVRSGTTTALVSMGAAQVMAPLIEFFADERTRFNADLARATDGGFRVLVVATGKGEEERGLRLAGLILLADPLDESSAETLRFMREHGIEVKMVTGDNLAIAGRIAAELGLPGQVLGVDEARHLMAGDKQRLEAVAAFAEVLPEDKLELVRVFQERHIVASTGDGINDMPALKTANVGIAVSNAVTALKSLADIVLLDTGIGVIRDAIIESRKIFVRLYNYSVYRISESFRLIITILALGLGYGFYPLMPIQLILLAFLNDIPIISLAFDRVETPEKPAVIHTRERFALSLLFGSVGVANSLIFFLLMHTWLGLPLAMIQTMFFLKLTVSGHALIFVAHTRERWYRFLPSEYVIVATFATQILATALALSGALMPAKISPLAAAFVWIWALLWMQVSELMKDAQGAVLRVLEKRRTVSKIAVQASV